MKFHKIIVLICILCFYTATAFAQPVDHEPPEAFATRICNIMDKGKIHAFLKLINFEFSFKTILTEDDLKTLGIIEQGQTYKNFLESYNNELFDGFDSCVSSDETDYEDTVEPSCEFSDIGFSSCDDIIIYYTPYAFMSEFDIDEVYVATDTFHLAAEEMGLQQCAAYKFVTLPDSCEDFEKDVDGVCRLEEILAFGLFNNEWRIIGKMDMEKPHKEPSTTGVDFYNSKIKESNFTACIQQLKNIVSGMEQYIAETGSLEGVSDQEDVCHDILAGHDEASTCRGDVKKRIDGICMKDTLKVEIIDDYSYSIMATPDYENACCICVTEEEVTPRLFEQCQNSQPCQCNREDSD